MISKGEKDKMFQEGDIVQITDEEHAWFPCLLIVSEVKSWGVQAYVLVPQSNDGSKGPHLALNRLQNESVTKVGNAIIGAK